MSNIIEKNYENLKNKLVKEGWVSYPPHPPLDKFYEALYKKFPATCHKEGKEQSVLVGLEVFKHIIDGNPQNIQYGFQVKIRGDDEEDTSAIICIYGFQSQDVEKNLQKYVDKALKTWEAFTSNV